jgi:hypothetical protein
VYVEFEHNNKIWGTIFLGTNGKPVRCTDDDTIPENISTTPITKETI